MITEWFKGERLYLKRQVQKAKDSRRLPQVFHLSLSMLAQLPDDTVAVGAAILTCDSLMLQITFAMIVPHSKPVAA